MKHKSIMIKNLMYKGCEVHYGCVICSECVPIHCYKRHEFEQKDCPGLRELTFPIPKGEKGYAKEMRKQAMKEVIK